MNLIDNTNNDFFTNVNSEFKIKENLNEPYKVLITGAAGNIGYSISFMIGQGRMFGPQKEIILHLFDLPEKINDLKGLAMELDDCSFSLIKKIVYTSDPDIAFNDIDYAILCGSKPRLLGMERKELLKDNAKIFEKQGKLIDRLAKKTVKVKFI